MNGFYKPRFMKSKKKNLNNYPILNISNLNYYICMY